MAFNTKGITIDIGGDASGFEKAMRKTKHEESTKSNSGGF